MTLIYSIFEELQVQKNFFKTRPNPRSALLYTSST